MFDPTLVKVSPNFDIRFGKSKRIGILNKGKDNKIIDCEFENLDIAIQDEGENTTAIRNRIK